MLINVLVDLLVNLLHTISMLILKQLEMLYAKSVNRLDHFTLQQRVLHGAFLISVFFGSINKVYK